MLLCAFFLDLSRLCAGIACVLGLPKAAWTCPPKPPSQRRANSSSLLHQILLSPRSRRVSDQSHKFAASVPACDGDNASSVNPAHSCTLPSTTALIHCDVPQSSKPAAASVGTLGPIAPICLDDGAREGHRDWWVPVKVL